MSDDDVRRAERILARHGMGLNREGQRRERWRLIALDTALELLKLKNQGSMNPHIFGSDIREAAEEAWELIGQIEKNAPNPYQESEGGDPNL